jgi:XTP/dITP diphosphohydrolase
MLSKLVLASHNKGKAQEISQLLAPHHVEVISASALALPEPEETGSSFEENALLKSRAALAASQLPALADDSGLAVDCLNGEPGIYSARWGGEHKDFTLAMNKVKQAIEARGEQPQGATAQFVCVLALSMPGQQDITFKGVVKGRLTFPPRGEHGFGYDPIFIPEDFISQARALTFAEIDAAKKAEISHRTRAFRLFEQWLQEQKLS